MSFKLNSVRTLRTVIVAGLLIALLGAVLGSIGAAKGPVWNWAGDHSSQRAVSPVL